jgi:uncharacterized protein (DUF924 family)
MGTLRSRVRELLSSPAAHAHGQSISSLQRGLDDLRCALELTRSTRSTYGARRRPGARCSRRHRPPIRACCAGGLLGPNWRNWVARVRRKPAIRRLTHAPCASGQRIGGASMIPTQEFEHVLRFWFPQPLRDEHATMVRQFEWWFRGGADAAIAERYPRLLERAARGKLDRWSRAPRSRLALIIVLDQFSRSLHRGTARAFAQDPQALALALQGIEIGHYAALETPWEKTLLLPTAGARRGPDAPGASGQAGRGARGTRAGPAAEDFGALGGAGPRTSRRDCPLRASSSSRRGVGAAIDPGGARVPGKRSARPRASAAALNVARNPA